MSLLHQHGTELKAGSSLSDGIAAGSGSIDLIEKILGTIGTDSSGEKPPFAGLKPEEREVLNDAIRGGLNHCSQTSIGVALSSVNDDETALQYEVEPRRLSADTSAAVERALKSDLQDLTVLEARMQERGVLALGVRMLNGSLTKTDRRRRTLRVNLPGILNYSSVSEVSRLHIRPNCASGTSPRSS